MDDVLAALDAQQQELGAVVDRLRPDQLTLPSRCPGWSVADVLLHLAQTNEMAVASVEGRVVAWMHDAAQGLPPGGHVDDWAGALVAGERGAPDQAVARWRASTAAQLAAFTTCPPHARLTWVSGELAARTLATTRLAEAWIHTVDAVVAVGPEPAPTARLWHVTRLAWRTLPYAFARAGHQSPGPVGFDLRGPAGDRWTFGLDDGPPTVVTGTAHHLCTVAGQRTPTGPIDLHADGPHAQAVLRLVRTFA